MVAIDAPSPTFQLSFKDKPMKLLISQLNGSEILAGLYHFDMTIIDRTGLIKSADILNQAALITLNGSEPFFLHGFFNQVTELDPQSNQHAFQCRLVPQLWRLTQRQNCRIFQNQSVPEIIQTLLVEHTIDHSNIQIPADNAKVEYSVQFQETDYDFLRRVLQEQGWHYHFNHQSSWCNLVFATNNGAFLTQNRTTSIPYHPMSSVIPEYRFISRARYQETCSSSAIRLIDYRFDKPKLDLNVATQEDQPLEHYLFKDRYQSTEAGLKIARDTVEATTLGQTQVTCLLHNGCCHAGQRISLSNHPVSHLNQDYYVLQSIILVSQPQVLDSSHSHQNFRWLNRLVCVPLQQPFKLIHAANRPLLRGPQTAVVVGPKQDEIYTDQYGRIKVRFLWDRNNRPGERSSCWVRVSQSIAGNQWGAFTLPRVGQEVIVTFENGNPERPIVTGTLYNGRNKPPFPLPEHKACSGFKSSTTPGGTDSHQIYTDDTKANEKIYLRSAGDLDLRLNNNSSLQVNRDAHQHIRGHKREKIDASRHDFIIRNLHESCDGSQYNEVKQDVNLSITGKQTIHVGNAITLQTATQLKLESTQAICLKAGASFITISPTGIAINGPIIRINEGGTTARPGQPADLKTTGHPDTAKPYAIGQPAYSASHPTVHLPPAIDKQSTMALKAQLRSAKFSKAPLISNVLSNKKAGRTRPGPGKPYAPGESPIDKGLAVVGEKIDTLEIDGLVTIKQNIQTNLDKFGANNVDNALVLAAGGVATGALEALFPTNALDFIPVGKASKIRKLDDVADGVPTDKIDDISLNIADGIQTDKVDRISLDSAAPDKTPLIKSESGGTLIFHENLDGHTIRKHIGKTDEQLLQRFETEPDILGSSSYPDIDTAQRAVGEVLSRNRDDIQDWLTNSPKPRLTLNETLDFEVGRVIPQGATVSQPSSKSFLLLVKDPLAPNGYRVHTSFPKPNN